MDSFLERFQGEGCLDSRGVFTINLEKAQVKLASFQLADFSQFPTFLLGAGQAAKASQLLITFPSLGGIGASRSTRIEFRNWTLDIEDLRLIGLESLKKETPRPIRYLATILSTLGAKHDFSLTSNDFQLSFQKGVMKPPQPPPDGAQVSSVTLHIETDLRRDLERGFAGQEKLSSLEVRFADKRIGGGYDPSLETSDFFSFLVVKGVGLPPLTFQKTSERVVSEQPRDGLPAMALGLSSPAEAERAGLWLLVEDLAYRAPRDFSPDGVFGVLVANELRRDQSFQVVQNAAYHRLREQLLEAARRLCRQAEKRRHLFRGEKAETLKKLCRQLGVKPTTESEASGAPLPQDPSPIRDPNKLGAFLFQLDKIGVGQAEALIHGYQREVSSVLRQGRPKEALEWQRALIAVKHRLQRKTPVERFAYQLLQILSDPGPAQFSTVPDLPDELANQARYMGVVCRWWAGKQVSEANLAELSLHCSWMYPLGLAPDCNHNWVRLLNLLSEAQVMAALDLLRSDSSLCGLESEAQWNQYFWVRHRGRLSWSSSIRLRVQLSFAAIARKSLDLSESTFASLQERLLYTEFQSPKFWPVFLEMKSRATPEDMRDFWVKLLARVLINSCLDDPTRPLLSRPLTPSGRWSYSRSGSTPSR